MSSAHSVVVLSICVKLWPRTWCSNGLNTGGRCMVCVCEGVRGGRCKGGGQGGVFLTFLHLVVIA